MCDTTGPQVPKLPPRSNYLRILSRHTTVDTTITGTHRTIMTRCFPFHVPFKDLPSVDSTRNASLVSTTFFPKPYPLSLLTSVVPPYLSISFLSSTRSHPPRFHSLSHCSTPLEFINTYRLTSHLIPLVLPLASSPPVVSRLDSPRSTETHFSQREVGVAILLGHFLKYTSSLY